MMPGASRWSAAVALRGPACWTRNAVRTIAADRGECREHERFPPYQSVDAAEGRYGLAVARLRHIVEVLPIPAYVILLGDILHISGHETQARRQYALVGAIERLFAANGVRTELQTAVFDLDHNWNIADVLARARTA